MKNTLAIVILIIILILGAVFIRDKKGDMVVDDTLTETETTSPIDETETEAPTPTTTTTACTSSSPASITVLSPNGGESYYKNEAFALKWKSCNLPETFHVNAMFINVDNSGNDMSLFCEGGSSTWTPVCLNDGDQMAGPGDGWTSGTYKLKLTLKESGIVSDMSNASFTIKAENAPTITMQDSGDDENGMHAGLIKTASSVNNKYSLTIDYVILDKCPPVEPGDKCLINDNTLIRTFPISSSAKIKSVNTSGELIDVNLSQFEAGFTNRTAVSLNWITIKNGEVTKIEPIYLP